MNEESSITFKWIVSLTERERVRGPLAELGVTTTETDDLPPDARPKRHELGTGEFEPLVVLSGAIELPVLARVLAEVYKDLEHGGLFVSWRGDHLLFRDAPEIKRGQLVFIDEKKKPRVIDLEAQASGDIATGLSAIPKPVHDPRVGEDRRGALGHRFVKPAGDG